MRNMFAGGTRRGASLAAAVAVTVVFGFLVGACGNSGGGSGDNGPISEQESGRIQVSPPLVSFPIVQLGESETRTLTITNSSDEGGLQIYNLEFEPEEGSSVEDISVVGGLPDEVRLGPEESKTLEFKFAPQQASASNRGVLRLFNTDPAYGSGEPLEVEIRTAGNRPDLQVNPSPVRFPRLPPGERQSRSVTARNFGDAPLTIYEAPEMAGDSDYQVKAVEETFPLELPPFESGGAQESVEELEFEVEYSPTANGIDEGEILLRSNLEPGTTSEEPTVTRVGVNANADAPCLLIDGTARNMGAVPLGGSASEAVTVQSCGSEDLEISGVRVAENSDDQEFSLNLGDHDEDGDGTLEEPIVLESSGEQANFAVEYEPESAGTDEATIILETNDPAQREAEVTLVATGRDGACPTAQVGAKVKGNSSFANRPITVAPLDTVVLNGGESEDPDGRVVGYDWRVIDKPEDSTVRLGSVEGEEDNDAQRQFRVLTAGDYEIGLQVEDNDGFTSCEEATATITAIPNEKVHVELTWTNPEDPDETDDTGSDVDLHMVKMGPGEWFEPPYDVYFDNPNNGDDGGAGIWNPENPSLDIDDTDGRGPENIQMDNPTDCQWYGVGVHYYQQKFGTAYATIRIYINEDLVFEKLSTPLEQGDQFWDVARIHWPTGRVYGVGEIRPAPPVGQKPPVTESMASSGLCTDKELY